MERNDPCWCDSKIKWKKCHGEAPRFFSNLADNNHCLQASILMVLDYHGIQSSWEGVDELTQFDSQFYTWTIAGVLALSKKISGVKFTSKMDYEEFARRGKEYLKEYWHDDPKWHEVQKKGASPNFSKEQTFARELVRNDVYQKEKIGARDFEGILKNHLIITLVSTSELYGDNHDGGHFILIYDRTIKDFIFHDPGLPPKEFQRILKEKYINNITVSDCILIPRPVV